MSIVSFEDGVFLGCPGSSLVGGQLLLSILLKALECASPHFLSNLRPLSFVAKLFDPLAQLDQVFLVKIFPSNVGMNRISPATLFI